MSDPVYRISGYRPLLSVRQTQAAIKFVKERFQEHLSLALNLSRVSAPVVQFADSGINDRLDGVQKPVSFRITSAGKQAEIVQSLAKWKRCALADYGFRLGEGLYADMNAIRPDEDLDCFHSIYVDQWDWEVIISCEQRNVGYLHDTVRHIYLAIRDTERDVCAEFSEVGAPELPDDIMLIHSQELADMYPALVSVDREREICREHRAVFIRGIGAPLADGAPHSSRASDYDDWISAGENELPGLNGDILVWHAPLQEAIELSSMGIRVDRDSLLRQLDLRGELESASQPYHQRLLADELPLTIGGGIGQSRICMVLLRKAHIGEVQSSLWPESTVRHCSRHRIPLL